MAILAEYFLRDVWRVMRTLAYHGAGKTGPFFEGWYFKLVSPGGARRVSVIPGIYIGARGADSHSFVQVIDGLQGGSRYISFPAGDFRFVPGQMDVTVAGNHFTRAGIRLDLRQGDFRLAGELAFSSLHPWPVTPLSPGVMGWFAWVPGMECYHGIVSMDHQITGELAINGQRADFTGGRGYMEKDWGRAMPRAWIWMQCNHFNREGVSLSFSVARIPWGGRSFTGFLGGLLLDGQLHRFTTYTGARVSALLVSESAVRFTLLDRTKRLMVTARRAGGYQLQAPTVLQMDRRIMETLSADIDITFEKKNNQIWQPVFSGQGQFAGLEVVGDTAALVIIQKPLNRGLCARR